MKQMELFHAVGELDDDILLDAEQFLRRGPVKRRSPVWLKRAGLAACAAAAVCAAWLAAQVLPAVPNTNGPAAEGVSNTDGPAVDGVSNADGPAVDGVSNADGPAVDGVSNTDGPAVDGVPNTDGPAVAESVPNTDRPAEETDAARPVVMRPNELAAAPDMGSAAMFALSGDDFVAMTRAELLAYYGAALPIEQIMPDLRAQTEEGWGIYRSGSRGVYFDANLFPYESADGTRGVYITLDKAFSYPTAPWALPGDSLRFTAVCGRELALFRYPDEAGNWCFYVEFEQNGVGYRVCGKNMHSQEFAAVLTALLEGEGESPGAAHTAAGTARTVTGTVIAGVARQTITSTEPDGSTATVVSYAGPLGLRLDGGTQPDTLRVELTPEQAERFASLSLGERVTVTFLGEPATIGTVWTQQLVDLSPADPA